MKTVLNITEQAATVILATTAGLYTARGTHYVFNLIRTRYGM